MDEKKDLTLEVTDFNFNDLQEPSEEARKRLHDAAMEKLQTEYIEKINHYMTHGNIPRSEWDALPVGLQKKYKEKFRGHPNHIKGVPMTAAQKEAQKRKKKKSRDKQKAARKARKTNYKNKK
jgi:hypothetical protein